MIPIVNHSLKYNRALDGLRGIAILLVLFFHLFPQYISFGYIGVDIFFVLSGFLITQIIYTKLLKQDFSFLEFYRNRVRRIFPALIIVLLFTLLIGYLFLFPSELAQLGHHIKSSAFFYQNFRLIDEVGYWDKAAQLKPLLHCWSLSIEEQFYLFWPLLIFIIYKSKIDLLKALIAILLFLIVIPYLLHIDNFYHSLSRFWELSFGGLVYAIILKFKNRTYYLNIWVIIVLLLLAFAVSYDNNNYSLAKTLIVVLSTGVAVVYISNNSNDKLFASNILVFFGLISYPLYLWHYVIISYMHIFGLDVFKYSLFVLLISILLSYLTYRYVEIYARREKSYKFASLIFVLMVIIGLVGQYIYKQKGLPNRTFLIDNKKFQKQFIRTPAKNSIGINLVTKVLGYKPINDYIKATSSDLNKSYVVIFGDSHAHTSYPGFAQEFKKRGLETILISNSSCPPYIGGAMGKNIKDLKQCQEKINNIYKFLLEFKNIKFSILATRAACYINDIGFGVVDGGNRPYNYHFYGYFKENKSYNQKEGFFRHLQATFHWFSEHNLRLYYLLEDPELGFLPKNCMERPFGIFNTQCKIKYRAFVKRNMFYRQRVKKISKEYNNITILDPENLYCDGEYCYAIKDGKMLYADDDHHSVDGSIVQAKFLMKDIFK